MEPSADKSTGLFRSIDWWTVGIYLLLVAFGWVSVCGASYSYGDVDLFSLSSRSGMQIVWIGTSVVLAIVILLLDDRIYEKFGFLIYGFMLLLLFLTIFNPHEIKGSRSWLVIGPLRLQPAEFAKFATALAVAKVMNVYGFDVRKWKDFAIVAAVVMLPMLFIVMQKETGSALVYLAFFLMFYREGMPGAILFTGFAMVVYFVVGIKYRDVMLLSTSTSVGVFVVLLLIQIFSVAMVYIYCNKTMRAKKMKRISWGMFGGTIAAVLVSKFIIDFDVVILQMVMIVAFLVYLVYEGFRTRVRTYYLIALFTLGSVLFFNATDYMLNNMLQAHQRVRINVLLGLEEDPAGAGYNVHQSEIAIGSGGFLGKGFLNGTQTKLKFVPEQDTDFIFCTVGEEQGFVGSTVVLLLFLALILRLIKLAERQQFRFARVYGYCVVSIFLFHVFINIGMVLGMTPVIGIPLPFFSYGGSSLWGFTLLLFIFLRIDAGGARQRKW
jgi:rod shape determining protein RodA